MLSLSSCLFSALLDGRCALLGKCGIKFTKPTHSQDRISGCTLLHNLLRRLYIACDVQYYESSLPTVLGSIQMAWALVVFSSSSTKRKHNQTHFRISLIMTCLGQLVTTRDVLLCALKLFVASSHELKNGSSTAKHGQDRECFLGYTSCSNFSIQDVHKGLYSTDDTDDEE